MSTVPPVSLANLYNDLDFLAGIRDKQKYSFGKRFYTNLDWIGVAYRIRDGEKQDVNGISIMEQICVNASQQWDSYRNNHIFGPELLNKMVAARHGLKRCVDTYESEQKTVSASSIKNRAILLLDNAIPLQRKIKEGIVLENHDTHVREISRSTPEAKEIIITNVDCDEDITV